MKKNSPSTTGKILAHSAGTGISTRRDLATRSRELAQINNHAEPRDDDRAEAKHDLAGDQIPTSEQDSISSRALTRDPSEPVSSFGSEVLPTETPDEQNASERLVAEGVEEAGHDQMLAARRQRKS